MAVIYFLVLTLALGLLTLPLSYDRGFVLSHHYGISTQNLGGWLADPEKGAILSLLFGTTAVAVVYRLLLAFPTYWCLLAWSFMLIVIVIVTIISLMLLVTLFFKARHLEDAELKERLKLLAQKARIRIQGIFTMDFSCKVTAANAGSMGMGRSRHIVISDTLIQKYTVPEIEMFTAHEIGHPVNKDIFLLFIVQLVIWLILQLYLITKNLPKLCP